MVLPDPHPARVQTVGTFMSDVTKRRQAKAYSGTSARCRSGQGGLGVPSGALASAFDMHP